MFRRSPTLSKLLRYLVEETVAGRSSVLKSFTVAVDGLGRTGDFDASSDSSARVQMVRLRKTLENHYAHHGPVDEHCIYLQPGSYTVRMGKLAVAYPTLYRPLSDAEIKPPAQTAPKVDETRDVVVPSKPALPFYRRNPVVSVCTLFGMMAGAVLVLFWQQLVRPSSPQFSPILEIMPVNSVGRPDLAPTAQLVASTFATKLPPFKIARIRVVGANDKAQQSTDRVNVYRLASRLVADEAGGTMLYLNIEDSRSKTTIWTREVALPTGQQATSSALIPLLGDISGPMGILATHGTMLTEDRNDGGYPCLLKYFAFVRTREKPIEHQVEVCFQKPVKEQRMEATILAARSFFAIERRSARDDFEAASKTGMKFARAAVAADPNDGSANFALARFSYLAKDCVSARFYTTRTMETNPNSAMFTATLAGLSGLCRYPDAEELLDQAFLTQSTYFTKGRLLLVLGALGQDRPEKIADIVASDVPQSRYNRVNYYLAETLIAASQGNRANTARYWQLFSQTIPPGSRTPDDKLRPIVALPPMRTKVIRYLAAGGAFE